MLLDPLRRLVSGFGRHRGSGIAGAAEGTEAVADAPEPSGREASRTSEGSAAREDVAEMRAALTRRLAWRARLLVEGSGPRADLGDGPALVRSVLEHGDDVVRPFPLGAQRALALCRNPESSLSVLVELFERDPALTQSLLTAANSSWYRGRDEEIVSIGAAVQRIGRQSVENLLLASIVSGTLCRPGPAHAHLVGRIWSHMLRTAPLARALAPAFGQDPEEAFTLGLLHDVGKLVAFDHLSAMRVRDRRQVRVPERFLLDAVQRLHEPLGGLAALRWGLGPPAARILSGHHRHPAPEGNDPGTEMVYVAERLDLALHVRFEPPDWEAIWQEGAITAEMSRVEECSAAV